MTGANLPHRFPKAALAADWLVSWKCAACGTWVSEYDPEESGQCSVDWRTGKAEQR